MHIGQWTFITIPSLPSQSCSHHFMTFASHLPLSLTPRCLASGRPTKKAAQKSVSVVMRRSHSEHFCIDDRGWVVKLIFQGRAII